jgi:hypothetical protein
VTNIPVVDNRESVGVLMLLNGLWGSGFDLVILILFSYSGRQRFEGDSVGFIVVKSLMFLKIFDFV